MSEPKVERLTEAGIVAGVSDLVNAIVHGTDKEAGATATMLLGSALINLDRIAAASERQAVALEKLTAGTFAMPNSIEFPVNMALTAEEVETIEALRRGDAIVVVPGPPKTDPDEDANVQRYYQENSGATVPWAKLAGHDRAYWRGEYRKHMDGG